MNNKTLYALRTILGLWLLVASVLFSATSNAEVDTGWMTKPEHPPVKTRFVVTGQVNQAEKTVEGFLQVELDDDWKTYWRSPGEGGVAPSISWENSVNLQSVEWHWPYPQQFNLLGIHTLGYKSATVIPMTLHIEDFKQPVKLDADLTLSSCTTICVLTDYPFSLTFVPSELEVSESAMFTHAQAISQVPKSSPLIEQQNAIWDPSSNQLQVTLTKPLGWSSPELIVDSRNEAISDYSYQLKSVELDGSKLVALFDVSTWLGEIDLSGQSVDVTVKDSDFVAEQSTSVSTGAILAVNGGFSLIEMVGFALLGGLILNVMPCVLPVLGMKLSGVIHAQGLARSKVRLQFIASSAGIITSFWLLAAFLLILKMSGNAIGWGIQFQSPWFIGLMVAVTALFGANMLGLFEFRLSANTNTWLASKGDDSYAGHYFQGMFATLLATPCSAPFLGTAVAFALAASALEMILIFTALALGMALPWLVVATFPGVAAYLPKPGAWMNKVKLLFGAMMLITSVWLLYLLTNHLPPFWVVVIAVAILVALLAKTKRVYGDKALAISGGASLILLVGAMVGGSVTAKYWSTPLPEDLAWRPLSDEIITSSVAQGKTVFVNVTADWCVTCKANKIGVILQDPVYSALNHSKVVPVQGDWTHPDGAVTDYLRANGRFGVPFNIVYGPSAPQGIALPVILTSDMVMSALEQASGERS